jgi:hypothetical protein
LIGAVSPLVSPNSFRLNFGSVAAHRALHLGADICLPAPPHHSLKSILSICINSTKTATLVNKPLDLNFHAVFTDSITPFTISVKDEFLKLTSLKISLTRFADNLIEPDPLDGPSPQIAKSVASYWTECYYWRKIETGLNSRLSQFITIVEPSPSPANYTAPVPVHFVHHRSKLQDAIPLLFVHGWPGSFIEIDSIISVLTDPPMESRPAFHVVAPSIPGYGFSPSPQHQGFGYRAAGATFHALMLKLGYAKYVFQGGDAGDFINRYAAHDFPQSVVSGLSNFWVIPPTESDRDRHRKKETSEDENYVIQLLDSFFTSGWAYGQIQQQRPLKLACGLTDSPVGLAMWIYDSVSSGESDSSIWTEERIITWTMMHWINGPYGAYSLYKNGAKVCPIFHDTSPKLAVPPLTYAAGRRNFYSRHPPSAVRKPANCHLTVST